MATLSDQQIVDLVSGTLKRLERLTLVQIAQRMVDYVFCGQILRKDKVEYQDGIGIQQNVMIDHSGAARMTGLYETDNVNVGDVMKQIDIPWRHTTTAYAFERRETLMNRGESRIVDLLEVRRADAMISLVELMETQAWSKPADSTNKTDVFGVPYWIVKWPTGTTTPGFTGGNPAGFTSGAGNLDATTYTRWKNYAGKYTTVSKDDLITKMRTMARKTNFKTPMMVKDFNRSFDGSGREIFMNEATINSYEALAEAQNENLGFDLASMDGKTSFKGNPVTYAPILDSDTSNPVYMVNKNWFKPVILAGDYLRESDPAKAPGQHNTFQVFVDLTWNIICKNRREQGVLSTLNATGTSS